MNIPTPPPAKTIQSAAIHTLEDGFQAASSKTKSNSPTTWQNVKEKANVQSKDVSEGDKSTSDVNIKKKQNVVLSMNNNQLGQDITLTTMLAETPIKTAYFSKKQSTEKNASEKDLLNYIKSLVKEASMEKITKTLG